MEMGKGRRSPQCGVALRYECGAIRQKISYQPVPQDSDLRAGGERAYTNRSEGPRWFCGDLRPFAQILSNLV